MPNTYIVIEIPYGYQNETDKTVHEILIPQWGEGGHIPNVIESLNSFFCGMSPRKFVSKRDKQHHRDGKNWGPKSLYKLESQEKEWREWSALMLKHTRKMLPDWPDITEFPRIKHDSLWDFYKYIGFDYKGRVYRDEKGNVIKYSVLS